MSAECTTQPPIPVAVLAVSIDVPSKYKHTPIPILLQIEGDRWLHWDDASIKLARRWGIQVPKTQHFLYTRNSRLIGLTSS
jgi:hypothetical protein